MLLLLIPGANALRNIAADNSREGWYILLLLVVLYAIVILVEEVFKLLNACVKRAVR